MGACAPWEVDESCCDLPDGVSIDETWQQVASDILWFASGKRYGTCPVTIRPCLRRCGGGSGFPWTPYKGADGEWRNLGCGCIDDPCNCSSLCEVTLPGPVASVTQVVIDGTELDPANYRVDRVGDGYRLVRTDGGCFPDCQDMAADCADEGAFCVTYQQGVEPDALAIAAVSQAACELTKACIPGCKTCRLPANVVSIVRRGVGINLEQIKTAIFALPLVASWLQAINPNALMSASTVWSPDVPRVRIVPTDVVS